MLNAHLNTWMCVYLTFFFFLWLLVQQKKILKLKGWPLSLCADKCEWARWLDRSKGRFWTQCGVDLDHWEHTLLYQGVLKGVELFRAMLTIGKLCDLFVMTGGAARCCSREGLWTPQRKSPVLKRCAVGLALLFNRQGEIKGKWSFTKEKSEAIFPVVISFSGDWWHRPCGTLHFYFGTQKKI